MGRKKRKVVEPPPTATMVGGVASPRRAMAMTTTMASMASHNVKMESGLPAVVVADHVFARPADPRAAAMAPSPPPTIATDPQGIKSSADDGSRAASSPSVHIKSATMTASNAEGEEAEDYLGSAKPASQYGLHSHAGDLVEEDIYVSDGSLDSDDDDDDVDDAEVGSEEGGGKEKKRATTEMVITTSKMGLMRRGGISSLLGAPQVNRTWVRPGDKDGAGDNGGDQSGVKKEEAEGDAAEEEENESLLDPAARLALQQRRIESAKAAARVMEASENAGRDPCLFSKRTAFDIRMDQIEEKPWDKADGAADPTDYFNYGMTEEDWLEYSERQLAVRQELTDASKQKRLPDPGIVLVVPRAPKVQGDRVAVRLKKKTPEEEAEEAEEAKNRVDESDDEDDGMEMGVDLGPLKDIAKKNERGSSEDKKAKLEESSAPAVIPLAKREKIVGGAWGAGAAKDSVLMRLIQEQSGGGMGGPGHPGSMMPPGRGSSMGGPPMGGPPMMGGPPPRHMMPPPPPPPKGGGMPGHPPPSMASVKQEGGYGDRGGGDGHRFSGDGAGGGGGQWNRGRYNPNFHQQGSGNSEGGEREPPPQRLHHGGGGGGRGGYPQQGHPNAGRGGFHGRPPFHQQQREQQHNRPPPGQYQRGGRGGGPSSSRYPQQHPQQGHPPQQGHWEGGGGRGGGGGGRGYRSGPPPRGGGPPSGGRGGPQLHGGNNWDSRKRPRDGFGGGDPRGDPRRGRW